MLNQFAAACTSGIGGNILGIPTWYKYLDCDAAGNIQNFTLDQILLIVAAVLEMLLRVGVLVAVIFIIVGGFNMMTSSGNPERVAGARTTIINAVVGLVIAIIATGVVSFLAGSFVNDDLGVSAPPVVSLENEAYR